MTVLAWDVGVVLILTQSMIDILGCLVPRL